MSKKTRDNPLQATLFDSGPPPANGATDPSGERRLFYATNASNLRSILASGLVRPRAGWPKYAPDFQDLTPGYIPLFTGGVPHSQIVDQVTKHDRHDLPAIVEFDAKSWVAPQVLCVKADGKCDTVDVMNAPKGTRMLLLRGVIPLADARKVHFASASAAKRFSSDCQALANTRVDLLAVTDDLTAVPDVSPVTIALADLPSAASDAATGAQMRRLDAVGGILSALTRMSEGGGEPLVRNVFFEWPGGQRIIGGQAVTLAEALGLTVTGWIQAQECQTSDTMCAVLCCTMDFLAAPQTSTGFSAEVLLDAISRQAQRVPEKERKLLLERLQFIRDTVLHDESPAAFFQRKGSPVLRGLLLFLLDSEYRENRVLPRGCIADPQDLLMAEVLRGALNGWSRVPVAMRGDPQDELAIGYAMARLVNAASGAIRFEARSFAWTDEGAALAAILREIAAILSDKVSPKALQQLVRGERAEELDVRVKAKRIKGVSKPLIERDLKKKGKKATLTFTLSLPLN